LRQLLFTERIANGAQSTNNSKKIRICLFCVFFKQSLQRQNTIYEHAFCEVIAPSMLLLCRYLANHSHSRFVAPCKRHYRICQQLNLRRVYLFDQ